MLSFDLAKPSVGSYRLWHMDHFEAPCRIAQPEID